MASLSMVFDILARDGASRVFNNVGNAAGRAGQQTSGFSNTMKAAGAALLGGGLITGLKSLYDAAAESAKISRLTEAAIRSTGGAANITADQVGQLAEALSRKTAIDDEAIQSASNLLLTFTRVRNEVGDGNDIFNQATAAALDMSTALGTDATSAATTLGKALNDPIKGISALGRAGVQFTADQKEQIRVLVESGNILEAQKIILGELTTQFGGAAEAAATPFDRLQVTLGNLAEEAGKHLIPVFDDFANILMDDVFPAVGNVLGFMADNVPLVLGLGTAIAAAAIGMGTLSGAALVVGGSILYAVSSAALALTSFSGMAAALGTAATAVAGFIAAVAPLAAIGGLVYIIADFVSASADVEERLDAASDAGQDFSSVLAEQGGEINQTTREAALLAAETAGLSEIFEDAGISSWTLTEALTGNREAFGQLLDAAKAADAQATLTGDSFGLFGISMALVSHEATVNADALRAMVDVTKDVGVGAEVAAGYVPLFGDTFNVLGEQARGAATATEESVARTQEATEEWLTALQGVAEGFIEPLSVYKDLLNQKTEAERAQAQATAEATESGEDSWEDYAETVSVSLDEYAQALEDQITAQENWRTNLTTIAQRGGTEVATILAEMGVEGAEQTALMASATEEDFRRMRDALIRQAELAGEGATAALGDELNVMALVGRNGSARTIQEVARQLGLGVGVVREIARKYGVELASGINPLLRGLGKPGIDISGAINSGGGFWAGGFTGEGGKYEPKGVVHGGEFVFTKEQTRKAGVGQLEVFAKMLDGYATGGFVGDSDVPRPFSTAPYRPPISTAGDATMGKAYDETRAWVAANLLPVGPGATTPNGIGGLGPAAARAADYVRSAFGFTGTIGGYAYRNIAGTNVLSKHALGKAIDVMVYDNFALGQRIADFFAGPGRGTFGVDNVIWNRRIHSGGGWGAYYGVSPHTDHPHIDFYKTGTDFVPHDGLAYLHKGEAVTTAKQNAAGTGRTVHLYTPDIPAAIRALRAEEHQRETLAPAW